MSMVKGRGGPKACLSRVLTGIEHQFTTSIDVCFLPRQRQRQRDPHRKRRRPSSIKDFLPTIGLLYRGIYQGVPNQRKLQP